MNYFLSLHSKTSRSVNFDVTHISETDSTNRWLRDRLAELSGRNAVVWADYQTAGRGQGTNTWESERGQNLTFSVLLHPNGVEARRQFVISMAVSLAVSEALGQYIGDISIKWPNDIYWRDGKIGGMLIENRLHGTMIRDSIVGIGLNVNQRHFYSNAPNPVSMWQVCGQDTDRAGLLDELLALLPRCRALTDDALKQQYMTRLYRRRGFHPYADKDGAFMAELADVEADGHLVLRDEDGRQRRYAFKEVTYII